MRHTLMILLVLAVVAPAVAPDAVAKDRTTAFDRITRSYETIRQALLHDRLDGVGSAALAIENETDAVEQELRKIAAAPGARAETESPDLAATIRSATRILRAAEDLEEARTAFGTLSKAMVRYRARVADPVPVVVFCSMAEAVWLQPKGEIGNPYYGQSMARCGEIVSE